MQKIVSIVALAAIVSLFGCDSGDQAKKGAEAAPTETAPRNPEIAGPGAITPDNTTISWVGTKPGGKHDGGFKTFSGSIKPVSGDITASTLSVDIDTNSLFADNAKVTNHLKSPDFFEVKKHPKATFVSTAIKADKQGEATHVITGDLTLHGTTKPILIPVKVATSGALWTLDGTFTIDRTDFGIAYSPDKVDKTVTIKVLAKVSRE